MRRSVVPGGMTARFPVLACIFALGCSSVDEGGAQALWEDIRGADYPSWARAPGYEQPRDTVSAHGDTAIVFVNDIVESALDGDSRSSWPAGSVIVKDIYEDGDKTLIAAMKREEGGWFFAEWEPDGEPEYAGFELDVCTDCHVSRNDRVRAFALP